ncbi:hypothetical protein D3C71_1437150 [compost metagenome]
MGSLQAQRLGDQCHRLFCRALLQTKHRHRACERRCAVFQCLRLLNGLPHHLRVVLRDLIKLLQCRTHFAQTCALLSAGARNFAHADRHAADTICHAGNAVARRPDQPRAGLDLVDRGANQFADFPCRVT